MDSERKISHFNYHINNAHEAIQAEHLNAVAKSVNDLEKNVIEISDDSFQSRALFALEHNAFANAIFIDEMKNPYKIFQAKSVNTLYDEKLSCIYVGNAGEGTVQSVLFQPEDHCTVEQVTIIADDFIPKGGRIDYFISADGISFFPIKNGQSDLFTLPAKGTGIFIKARLIKNTRGETPKIYGWAALYRDIMIEKLYGLENVDLSRFDASLIGDTVLVRDRKQDDRVILVIDPDGVTQLAFDKEKDRLAYIIETEFDKCIKETMNYGQYLNSKGVYEEALLGTTRSSFQEPAAQGTMTLDILKRINDILNSTKDPADIIDIINNGGVS